MRPVSYKRLPTSDSKTAVTYASDSSDYEGEKRFRKCIILIIDVIHKSRACFPNNLSSFYANAFMQ